MKLGALFMGYGGLDLAVSSVFEDVELAWYAEIEKGANKILDHRFPGTPNIGDVTAVDWSAVEPVDILTGGSPCQDLSNAGKRAGMSEGTRSNLWVAMREAIAVMRPRLVVWENVRGAYSARADCAVEHCAGCMGEGGTGPFLRALGRVLGDLADIGYDAEWRGVRASDIGACHQRQRVFLAAYPRGEARELRSRLRPREQAEVGWGRSGDGYLAVAPADDLTLPLFPTPTVQDGANNGGPSQFQRNSLPLNALVTLLPTPNHFHLINTETPDEWIERRREVEARTGTRHGPALPVVLKSVAEGRPLVQAGNGPEFTDPGTDTWGIYGPAVHRWEEVLGRLAPDPTAKGPQGAMRLNPAFVEWMMGLPVGWITDVPDIKRNEALKALGNGVVPQQAAEALRQMFS